LVSLWELAQRQEAAELQAADSLPTTSRSGSSQVSAVSNAGSTSSGSASAQTSQTSSQQVPTGYILLAPLSAMSGRTSAYFTHPTLGPSILLKYTGEWKAFSSVCTHAGCTVQFSGSSVYCPCHSGYYSPGDGSVQSGPLPSPLPEYDVLVANGSIYVGTKAIN
jgi:Rieske Fe-S protein